MHEIPGDHPRVGGEKIVLRIKVEVIEGSPPRGRGKVDFLAEDPARAGITPAWAGKSDVDKADEMEIRDHPRVGGEKLRQCRNHRGKSGSPPRGRGKGWPPPPLGLSPRITPAWAGKSCWCFCRSAGCWDHPRVGGEKLNGGERK